MQYRHPFRDRLKALWVILEELRSYSGDASLKPIAPGQPYQDRKPFLSDETGRMIDDLGVIKDAWLETPPDVERFDEYYKSLRDAIRQEFEEQDYDRWKLGIDLRDAIKRRKKDLPVDYFLAWIEDLLG